MNRLDFAKRKAERKRLSVVTAYDAPSARLAALAGIDCLLVGDSVAMVVHGMPTTLGATVELMALHTEAVRRGAPDAFVVVDMPFLSFRRGIDRALDAVFTLMQAGATAVKLEGVRGHEEIVQRIVQSGVPVMGHVGMTPQSVHELGGFRVEGRDPDAAAEIRAQAELLEQLGCFSVVLECIPNELGRTITQALKIPTIGIGAGPHTDGQVLVFHDLLGFNSGFHPKFVRRYFDSEREFLAALKHFDRDVKAGEFPTAAESYE